MKGAGAATGLGTDNVVEVPCDERFVWNRQFCRQTSFVELRSLLLAGVCTLVTWTICTNFLRLYLSTTHLMLTKTEEGWSRQNWRDSSRNASNLDIDHTLSTALKEPRLLEPSIQSIRSQTFVKSTECGFMSTQHGEEDVSCPRIKGTDWQALREPTLSLGILTNSWELSFSVRQFTSGKMWVC